MKLAIARDLCRKAVVAGGRAVDRYIDTIAACAVHRDGQALHSLRETVTFAMIEKIRSSFGGSWDEENRLLHCDDGVHAFSVNPILDPFNCVLEMQAPGTFCGMYEKSSSGSSSLVVAAAYVNSTVGVIHAGINEHGLRWNNRPPKQINAPVPVSNELKRCAIGCDVGMGLAGASLSSFWLKGQIRPIITSPLLALLALFEERVNECHLHCSPETLEGMAFFAERLTGNLASGASGHLTVMDLSSERVV